MTTRREIENMAKAFAIHIRDLSYYHQAWHIKTDFGSCDGSPDEILEWIRQIDYRLGGRRHAS